MASSVKSLALSYNNAFIQESKLIVKRGMTGDVGNIYYGLGEFEDMSFLLHLLREEDYFADIGANIGSYSILASSCCRASTIAFEPIPETFETLKLNVKINNIEKEVETLNIGLGSKSDVLNFTLYKDATNHVVLNDNDGHHTIKIEVNRLDDVITRCPILIKLDVEGFESEVLKGAFNILSNPDLKAIVIELNGSGEKFGFDDTDIVKSLQDLGFKPYKYLPFQKKLEELASANNATNTIFIRDFNFVLDRIANSESFEVLGRKI